MFEHNKDQKYTEKWFDGMIPTWTKVFSEFIDSTNIKNVLEIGCYEGRATSFVCEKYLQKDTNYDIVDTFRGSIEESGMSRTAKRLSEDDFIYNNFIHNISFYPDINFNINKGFSQYLGQAEGNWNFHISTEVQNVNLYDSKELCTHKLPNKL